MTTIKVTNQPLFDNTINDVDTSGLHFIGTSPNGKSMGFRGHLCIELDGGEKKDIFGEFGENDYDTEFGFQIVYQD